MQQIKAVGACVVGSFAILSAAFVGVAQATLPAPEFLSGEKAITSIGFTAKAGSGAITWGGSSLIWTEASATAKLEAPDKITALKLTFKGSKIGSCPVNSQGAAKGEVVTKELKGHLGYISETGPSVGALFEPVVAKGIFVETEKSGCSEAALKVTGSVIGKITPINKETTTPAIKFGASGKGQEVTKFEGESTEHHLSIGELPGVFECSENLTTEKAVEIKT